MISYIKQKADIRKIKNFLYLTIQLIKCPAATNFFVGIELQSVKMVKDKWVRCSFCLVGDKYFVILLVDGILLDIPGSQSASRMLQNVHTIEPLRPVIQVFLIT